MDDVKWLAGGESTKGTNIPFQPNIPTEECFTTPHRLKTNGIGMIHRSQEKSGEVDKV
jgi:aminopeptidase